MTHEYFVSGYIFPSMYFSTGSFSMIQDFPVFFYENLQGFVLCAWNSPKWTYDAD